MLLGGAFWHVAEEWGMAADPPARPPAGAPTAGQGTATPSRSAAEPASVTVRNGVLSIEAGGRPLAWVLDQVSRASGVVFLGDLAGRVGRQRVSVRLKGVPLEQGLKELLGSYDTFFYYEAGEKGAPTLRAVWGYPKGRGRGLVPVPPEDWASTKEIAALTQSTDPAIRARMVGALIARVGPGAIDTVITALGDQTDQVRTQAIFGALNAGVPIPVGTLSLLALSDPSADVRFLALDALASANDPTVTTVAEQALNDESPAVQAKAREILKHVGGPPQGAASNPAP